MVAVHSSLFPAMDESLKLWFAVIGTPYLGYTKISPSRTFDAPEGDDYQRVGNCWVHQTLEGETSTVLLQSSPRPRCFGRNQSQIPGHSPSRRRQNIVQQIGQIGPNLLKSVPVVHF